MDTRKIAVAVLLLLATTELVAGLSATIGNARVVLRPELTPGRTTFIERSLLVRNVNNFSVKVSLELDSVLTKIVDLPEKNYVLQAGQELDVPFTIMLKEEGYYEGRIYVLFQPNEAGVKDSPVGLTSTLVIITSNYDPNVHQRYVEETPTTPEINTTEPPVNEETNSEVTTPKTSTTTSIKPSTTTNSRKPSQLVGIIVAIVVVVVGGFISYLVLRRVW